MSKIDWKKIYFEVLQIAQFHTKNPQFNTKNPSVQHIPQFHTINPSVQHTPQFKKCVRLRGFWCGT